MTMEEKVKFLAAILSEAHLLIIAQHAEIEMLRREILRLTAERN